MSDLQDQMAHVERDLQEVEQQIAALQDDEAETLRGRRHKLKNDLMDLRIRIYLETGE